ncbi:MAG: DUF1189 family protein [Candidatus Paceibacterota bacterium]
MKFLHDLRAAVYSPNFLAHFKNRTFNQAVLFIFVLVLIQTLITEVIVLTRVVNPFITFTSGNFIKQYYPEDLDVTVTDGLVATNQANPYLIANPDVRAGTATGTVFSNIVVIDTQATDTISALHRYNTYVLVTHDSVASENGPDGEIRVIPLKNIKNLHLTQPLVQEYFTKAIPYIYGVGILGIILLPLLVAAFSLGYYLFILLGLALITWFIARLRKVDAGYKKSYILSGYLLALPILTDLVLDLIIPGSRFVLIAVIFVLIAILNVKQEKDIIQAT